MSQGDGIRILKRYSVLTILYNFVSLSVWGTVAAPETFLHVSSVFAPLGFWLQSFQKILRFLRDEVVVISTLELRLCSQNVWPPLQHTLLYNFMF